MEIKFFIGFDPNESEAYDVLHASLKMHNPEIQVQPIILSHMQERGLMTREFFKKGNVTYDRISDAPCSTEFSLSRFLTLHLAKEQEIDYAVFMDCDMLVTCDMEEAVREVVTSGDAPVWCVKHDHKPDSETKMDGQIQTQYGMKNWSSFVIYDVNHPLNNALTLEMINTRRGLDLHQFCWLEDKEVISTLGVDWNWLVGYYQSKTELPKNIHYTEGVPSMEGYSDCEYADLWWDYYNEIYK